MGWSVSYTVVYAIIAHAMVVHLSWLDGAHDCAVSSHARCDASGGLYELCEHPWLLNLLQNGNK
jgi:hypothetical protein